MAATIHCFGCGTGSGRFFRRLRGTERVHGWWGGGGEACAKDGWGRALGWGREKSAVDAVFALGRDLMQVQGEGTTGFRWLAQRSRLADLSKDRGAVSMFPPFAEQWWAEVQA